MRVPHFLHGVSRRGRLLWFVLVRFSRHRSPASQTAMARAIGARKRHTAARYLRELEAVGLIHRDKLYRRGPNGENWRWRDHIRLLAPPRLIPLETQKRPAPNPLRRRYPSDVVPDSVPQATCQEIGAPEPDRTNVRPIDPSGPEPEARKSTRWGDPRGRPSRLPRIRAHLAPIEAPVRSFLGAVAEANNGRGFAAAPPGSERRRVSPMWMDARVRSRSPEEIASLRGMGQECVRKLYLFAGITDDSYYSYKWMGAFEKAAILYGYQPMIDAMAVCQDRNDNIRSGRAARPREKWGAFFWGVLRNVVLRSGQRWGADGEDKPQTASIPDEPEDRASWRYQRAHAGEDDTAYYVGKIRALYAAAGVPCPGGAT